MFHAFVFPQAMYTCARAQDDITKKLFPRVASRGLKWENKTYKVKRSIFINRGKDAHG